MAIVLGVPANTVNLTVTAASVNLNFVVQAAELWNPSNVLLVKGGNYTLSVPAVVGNPPLAQRWNDTHVTVDAAGYESYYDAVSRCHVARCWLLG